MAAKIDERAFRSYTDGQDRMTAAEYMRDREVVRQAVNDLEDKISVLDMSNNTQFQQDTSNAISILDEKINEILPLSMQEDENFTVNIQHVYDPSVPIEYWVTTITPKDSESLQGLLKKSFAKTDGTDYNMSARESVHEHANRVKATFAINASGWFTSGDERITGVQIKDGVIIKDSDPSLTDWYTLGVDSQGILNVFPATVTGTELVNNHGIVNTWAFSIPLIMNGEEVWQEIYELYAPSYHTPYPRQVIGQVQDTNEIVILTVDGTLPRSKGLTLPECSQILLEKNCRVAYNFDGGGSSQTFYRGEYLNNPADGTYRETPDLLYISKYDNYDSYLDIQKQVIDATGSFKSLKEAIDKGQKAKLTRYDGTVEYASGTTPFDYNSVTSTKFFRRYNNGTVTDLQAPFPGSVDVYGVNIQSKDQSSCQLVMERKTGKMAIRFNNIGTWGSWKIFSSLDKSVFTKPALQNGWVNVGGSDPEAQYCLKDGWVYVKGSIKGGTANAAAFVLPEGYRPKTRLQFGVVRDNGSGVQNGRVFVTTSGGVNVVDAASNYLYLDIHFPVEQ